VRVQKVEDAKIAGRRARGLGKMTGTLVFDLKYVLGRGEGDLRL
jgi:hypothetical protein